MDTGEGAYTQGDKDIFPEPYSLGQAQMSSPEVTDPSLPRSHGDTQYKEAEDDEVVCVPWS